MKHRTRINKALVALDADGLRTIIQGLLPWLDDSTLARLLNALTDRAARGTSGWAPPGPTATVVAEVETFAAAAVRVGHADPQEVDEYLRHGVHAFLGKDYAAAFSIFRALLLPIANVDIDLGQHEMLSEVLSVDTADCAAQYVVSVYMTGQASAGGAGRDGRGSRDRPFLESRPRDGARGRRAVA